MELIILANGPEGSLPNLTSYLTPSTYWIGVDRGVYTLLQHGITPYHAFGDFDSLTDEERRIFEKEDLPFSTYPCEKDKTDLEIALDWAVTKQPERITILGATGGRMDHALINIQMLKKGVDAGIPIRLQDEQNKLSLHAPGRYRLKKESLFPYVSFLPFTSVIRGLTLEGFKYPLVNQTVHVGSSLCISNELVDDTGWFTFTEGVLISIKSRDV